MQDTLDIMQSFGQRPCTFLIPAYLAVLSATKCSGETLAQNLMKFPSCPGFVLQASGGADEIHIDEYTTTISALTSIA